MIKFLVLKLQKTVYLTSLIFFMSSAFGQSQDEIRGAIESGDFEVARSLATQLVKKNDPVGHYTIGWLDERKRTDKGYASSFSSYLKAAKLGHVRAMYFTAQMLKEGRGTKKNIEQAVFWFEKASETQYPDAMYELAEIYRGGHGLPVNNQKAYALYQKIALEPKLENSELWTMSFFFLGLLTRDSTDAKTKESSESFFELVMQSKLSTKPIDWAKSEIQSYADAGQTKVGRGDGSEDDLLCQKFGFKVVSQPYSECRLKIEIAKKQNAQAEKLYAQQKRQFEAEQQRYQEEIAAYEKEKERKKGLAMLQFGLALMAGQSPNASDNFANAGRSVLGIPPVAPSAPNFQNFTITGPTGRMTTCNVFGNNVKCN